MKLIITLPVLMGLTLAAPQFGNTYNPYNTNKLPSSTTARPLIQTSPVQRTDDSKNAVILRYENEISIDGYHYEVETSDSQSRAEHGDVLNFGTDAETLAVRGEYTFTAPNGVVFTVRYVADENGFQPEGDHLPRAQ